MSSIRKTEDRINIICAALSGNAPLLTIEKPANQKDINSKCGLRGENKYVKKITDFINYPYHATQSLVEKLFYNPNIVDEIFNNKEELEFVIKQVYPHIGTYFQYTCLVGEIYFLTLNASKIDRFNYIIIPAPWSTNYTNETVYTVGEFVGNNRNFYHKTPYKFVDHFTASELCCYFSNILVNCNKNYDSQLDCEWQSRLLQNLPNIVEPKEKKFNQTMRFDFRSLPAILDQIIIDDYDGHSYNYHESQKRSNEKENRKIEFFDEIYQSFGINNISKRDLKRQVMQSVEFSSKCAQMLGNNMVLCQIYFNKCYYHSEFVLPCELANPHNGEIYKFGIVFIEENGFYVFKQLLTPYMIFYNIGLNYPNNMGIIKRSTIQWWPSHNNLFCKYYSFLSQMNLTGQACIIKKESVESIDISDSFAVSSLPPLPALATLFAPPAISSFTPFTRLPPMRATVSAPLAAQTPKNSIEAVQNLVAIDMMDNESAAKLIDAIKVLNNNKNDVNPIESPMIYKKGSSRKRIRKTTISKACPVKEIKLGNTDNEQLSFKSEIESSNNKFNNAKLLRRTGSISTKSCKMNKMNCINKKKFEICKFKLEVIKETESEDVSNFEFNIDSTMVSKTPCTPKKNRGKGGKKINRAKKCHSPSNLLLSPVSAVTETVMKQKDEAFTDWYDLMSEIPLSNGNDISKICTMGMITNHFCDHNNNVRANIDGVGNIRCEYSSDNNGFEYKEKIDNFWNLFEHFLNLAFDKFYTNKINQCKEKHKDTLHTFEGIRLWLNKEVALSIDAFSMANKMEEDNIIAKKSA